METILFFFPVNEVYIYIYFEIVKSLDYYSNFRCVRQSGRQIGQIRIYYLFFISFPRLFSLSDPKLPS